MPFGITLAFDRGEMSAPAEKRTEPGDVHLKRLQRNCEINLQRLISTATDSCNATEKLRILPLSREKRLEIFLQMKKEDKAFAAYRKARNALLDILEADPELVNSANLTEPGPAREYGQPRTGMHRRRDG
jgi:hypothetical protein